METTFPRPVHPDTAVTVAAVSAILMLLIVALATSTGCSNLVSFSEDADDRGSGRVNQITHMMDLGPFAIRGSGRIRLDSRKPETNAILADPLLAWRGSGRFNENPKTTDS